MQSFDNPSDTESTQTPEGFKNSSLQASSNDRFGLFSWDSQALPALSLPPNFPETTSCPKYQMGSRCRWIPNPHTDWGTIIGQIYSPYRLDPSSEVRWSWLYLLLLDPDSPSQQWLVADWVEEEQLEVIVFTPSENSDLEGFHEPSP
jgi:hypothetical protein